MECLCGGGSGGVGGGWSVVCRSFNLAGLRSEGWDVRRDWPEMGGSNLCWALFTL